MLKYLRVARFCSYAVRGPKNFIDNETGELRYTGETEIGQAFYPLLHKDFLTQSCDPNVCIVFVKNEALVYSTQMIEKETPVRNKQGFRF